MTRIDRIMKHAEQIVTLRKRIKVLPPRSPRRALLEYQLRKLVTQQIKDEHKAGIAA